VAKESKRINKRRRVSWKLKYKKLLKKHKKLREEYEFVRFLP
jgi:hypothetical protein